MNVFELFNRYVLIISTPSLPILDYCVGIEKNIENVYSFNIFIRNQFNLSKL